MAIEHILTDADTVQSLAYRYLGDASRWKEIVDYNSLEHPYTLTSQEAYRELYASGYLTLTRELFQSRLTIYKGSLFSTKVDSQGVRKVYEVTEDTDIMPGSPVGYVYVRCTDYGSFGNTIADSVIEQYRVNSSLGRYMSNVTVTNAEPFVNGTDATVKVTGQAVYIPQSSEDEDISTIGDVDSFLTALGGTDIMITSEGDMDGDGFGDLGIASGIDNIRQAVQNRLTTERGSIPHHPEYGTRLNELIGKSQLPYALKLMELDIHESLSYEDRISQVTINSVEVKGTSIYVDLTLKLSTASDTFRLQLDF